MNLGVGSNLERGPEGKMHCTFYHDGLGRRRWRDHVLLLEEVAGHGIAVRMATSLADAADAADC